jgi:surface protein
MSAIGANAQEAYANYTPSNTTLTFYYDNQRNRRTGTTYDLNTGSTQPEWIAINSSLTKVIFDSSFAGARPTSTYYWFNGTEGLQSITGIEYLNTSEVTNMTYMFANCEHLTSLDVSRFNTAKVTSMNNMFYYCSNLTSLNLASFNTANVKDMRNMFMTCKKLETIYVGGGWSTKNVTMSNNMFKNCTNLKGGQGTTYDASHVDMTYAHIDGGTSNPGYFTAAPEAYACYTSSNKTLTFYYDTQRSSRSGTNYDLNTGANDPGWYSDGTRDNVTKVVFDPSFAEARPTTTYAWFSWLENLQSITGMKEYLNTSEVTNMTWMFERCKALTRLDLSSFNTSKAYDMSGMFYECSNLQTIYVGNGWSTSAVTNSSDMFLKCTSLVGGKGTTYNASHIDKAYAHIDGGTSNPGYFTEWKEAYACYTSENTTLTFYCDNLRNSRTGTTYDLNESYKAPGWEEDGSNTYVTKVVFKTSFADARPTSTYDWFYDMEKLQSITGMEYLNTSEVTNMFAMFGVCKKMKILDLSSFNTAKVNNMGGMFVECSNLQTIYVGSDWSTTAVTYSVQMFLNCTNLVGGQGTTYSAGHMEAEYAHIDGGSNNPGYFTYKKPSGIATDLHQVTSDKSQVTSDEWYTIDGRKLNGMPAKKGVYIQNGKKTIVH